MKVHTNRRIAIVANTGWYIRNFRLPLMLALREAGYEVTAVSPADTYSERLIAAGFRHHPIPLDPTGTNPLLEARSILALRRVLKHERFDAVFSFTPKGNIYAALALAGQPARLILTISGLGRIYATNHPLKPLLTMLFRHAFNRAEHVLFQNADDLNLFVAGGIVDPAKVERIPGSGVDLTRFANASGAQRPCGEQIFVLVARMLWAKGVGEYAEAAKRLKSRHPGLRFLLLGPIEPPGDGSVPESLIRQWNDKGWIEYLGAADDVRPIVGNADCVVLPSKYREGVPRSLLEAAAMGKPTITTDMPGCRDVVEDGVTGLICRPNNAGDLADKLETFAALDAGRRREMGEAAHAKMAREFDIKGVTARYLALAVPRPKIVLAANTGWFLFNFRLALIRALTGAGYDVVALTPVDEYTGRLVAAGVRHRPIPLSRTGINPLSELRSILALRRVLRIEKAQAVLGFTPKGNIYGGIASFGLPLRVIATVNGLGRVFVGRSWVRLAASALYRLAFLRTCRVLVENDEDRHFFVSRRFIGTARCERIPGLGVDLDRFRLEQPPAAGRGGGPVFLLIARLIKEKGIGLFVEAARAIRAEHPEAEFRIAGQLERENPSAIAAETLKGWVAEGAVGYLGVVDDIRKVLTEADCIVLPTYYREGVPRSLMEAAAMGKAIVTTDTPGCRDVVEDGVTGFLCRPRDAGDLTAKLKDFIALAPDARRKMGEAARAKMEREFDERAVIARYLSLIAES
jgi:glycosyltransferase involved in cell wall biosynthesis